MNWFRWRGATLLLTLRIQPDARRSGFAGLHDGALKVRVAAPPIEGRANRELIEFLAETFGTAKTNVSLLRGASGRTKTASIHAPMRIPAEVAALAPDLRLDVQH